MEDIVADDLGIVSEEEIRTDAADQGGGDQITTFQVRDLGGR